MNKTNRNYKIGKLNNFRAIYSTVNKNKNNSFYLTLKSWVKPEIQENNYTHLLNKLKNKTKTIINGNLIDEFYSDYILDFSVTHNSMHFQKCSFLNIEITFYPKQYIKFDDPTLREFFIKMAEDITKELNSNENFTFNVTKT